MLLACSPGEADLWHDTIFLLLLGVLVGGVSTFLVERSLVWRRRKHVCAALLPYLRGCCNQARDLQNALSEMIHNWTAPNCATYSFRAFDTSFWQALLQNIDQLPAKYWTSLIGFHAEIASIQFALDFLRTAQMAFTEARPADQQAAQAIRQRVLDYADRVMGDCGRLARFASIADLEDFRKRWPTL